MRDDFIRAAGPATSSTTAEPLDVLPHQPPDMYSHPKGNHVPLPNCHLLKNSSKKCYWLIGWLVGRLHICWVFVNEA
jgi:hypothetical protein